MRVPPSAWISYTILLISLCTVEAYDEAFKEALLSDFRKILDYKLEEVKEQLKERFDHTDREMEAILNDLYLVTGSIHTIEGEVSAITGRSSQSQLNIRDVKLMQENMNDEVLILREKVETFDETMNEIRNISNNTFEELQNIGNDTLEILQDVTQYLDDIQNSSSVIEENKDELKFLRDETTEILEYVTQDLKMMNNESKLLLQGIGQELVILSNETRGFLNQSFENIMTNVTTLGEDINEVKLLNENSTSVIINSFKSDITSLETQFNTIEDRITMFDDMEDRIKQEMILSDNKMFSDIKEEVNILKDSLTTVISEQSIDTYKLTTKLDIVEKLLRGSTTVCPTTVCPTTVCPTTVCPTTVSPTTVSPTTVSPTTVCPTGYFRLVQSGQCFAFDKKRRTYTEAKAACASVGAVLAKPKEPEALQAYIVNTYGDPHFTWLGARGTGSTVQWDRDGVTVSASLPLWYQTHPGPLTSSSYCLTLLAHTYYMKNDSNKGTYYMASCTVPCPSICEFLRE